MWVLGLRQAFGEVRLDMDVYGLCMRWYGIICYGIVLSSPSIYTVNLHRQSTPSIYTVNLRVHIHLHIHLPIHLHIHLHIHFHYHLPIHCDPFHPIPDFP